MKKSLHKLLLTILLACATISAAAYDFEVDGFYYTKLSDSTVKLTCDQYDCNAGTVGVTIHFSSTMSKYSGIITIPASVSDGTSSYDVIAIDDAVFYGCSNLTSITIPKSIASIGHGVFYNCSGLTSIVIPDGVTYIGGYAFAGCSGLTSINIPIGVTIICSGTFQKCKGITSITIPNGVTRINMYSFQNCSSLTSITIPNGVTAIGYGAFSGCSGLTSITIPDGVTSIGESAFFRCSGLTSINIPDRVTSIGDYTFSGCSSLTSITIHDEVTSIGNSTFSNCTNVNKIVCLGETPPECGTSSLDGISRTDCVLYVSKSSVSKYEKTSPWSEFENIVYGSSESGGTPQTCATPTVSFDNDTKRLKFSCATNGAKINTPLHVRICKPARAKQQMST